MALGTVVAVCMSNARPGWAGRRGCCASWHSPGCWHPLLPSALRLDVQEGDRSAQCLGPSGQPEGRAASSEGMASPSRGPRHPRPRHPCLCRGSESRTFRHHLMLRGHCLKWTVKLLYREGRGWRNSDCLDTIIKCLSTRTGCFCPVSISYVVQPQAAA